MSFRFLEKVFTTTESSGRFLFYLNDVLILTYFFIFHLGVGVGIVLFLVRLSFASFFIFFMPPLFSCDSSSICDIVRLSVCRSVGRSVGRSVRRSVGRSVGRSVRRSVRQQRVSKVV